MKSSRRLRRHLLTDTTPLLAPGVYDGLSALIAESAGFSAVYVSGGAIARSCGVPDIGLLTLNEVLDRTAQIVNVVRCPVIADIDTGYGGPLNVARTVREFERIGVAGFHIEDQVNPKRCGHYDDKAVVEVPEMLARLRAALDARSDPDVVVIARTDARAPHGLDTAIARGQLYADAGADLVFVEAPESRSEIESIARGVSVPLVINMFQGGKTPLMTVGELGKLGYRLIIVPSDLQRAAMFAMKQIAKELRRYGFSKEYSIPLSTFTERDELVRLPEYVAREAAYDGRVTEAAD